MIINWIRHKVKDYQEVIFANDIVDDIPDDEIPDKFKSEAESSADIESNRLYRNPIRPGDHSFTHSNTY